MPPHMGISDSIAYCRPIPDSGREPGSSRSGPHVAHLTAPAGASSVRTCPAAAADPIEATASPPGAPAIG